MTHIASTMNAEVESYSLSQTATCSLCYYVLKATRPIGITAVCVCRVSAFRFDLLRCL